MSFRFKHFSACGPFAPTLTLTLTAMALVLSPARAPAQTVLSGDHSVDGFLCAGSECTNAEARNSLDLLRLKQDNVQIEAVDTTSGSGPDSNDWLLEFNNASTGFFRVHDESGNQDIFTLRAGAGDNALYVGDTGHVGLGTAIPQTPLHVETESNQGIRLNRSNASGGAQAWEVLIDGGGAFALADIKNGHLPLGILPDTPDSSLVFFPDGVTVNAGGSDFDFAVVSTQDTLLFADAGLERVGISTALPQATLHVARDDGTAGLLVEDTSPTPAARQLLALRNNGQTYFTLEDTSRAAGPNSGRAWNFQNLGGEFRVTTAPGGGSDIEMRLDVDGNMRIEGNYFANSFTELDVPDYVFEPDYDLRPLADVQAFIAANKHLPDVPPAAQIVAEGVNLNTMQMTLLKKVEELTLYTLKQQDLIAAQTAQITTLQKGMDDVALLRAELQALRAALHP